MRAMQRLGPSGHEDDFARARLPRGDLWPRLDLAGFDYPHWLNAGVELTDAMVARGHGERTALIGTGRARSYRDLAAWTDSLAHALVADHDVRPGNRVLIRGPNTPALVACWLAATKAGAVVVNTMPMLREAELAAIIDKARISHALCDTRQIAPLAALRAQPSSPLRCLVGFDGTAGHDAPLDRAALARAGRFPAVRTGRDDVALLAFTSGSTGQPKATAHFHRDLLAIADGYAREVLEVTPEDVFAGSPPLGFTFGLGGLAVFPLRFGAAAVLVEDASPGRLPDIIRDHRVTICLSVPTAYRAMLRALTDRAALSSLRLAVSAGEPLPAEVWTEWRQRTGTPILDGLGSTEMLHIFISNRVGDSQPGSTGHPVRGYRARILDADGREAPRGVPGRLAVMGPTGCRYLDDPRQAGQLCDGWTLTGDTCVQETDGRFRFIARSDDMILSAGYNIAAPEVEAALLSHPDVADCAVTGRPDAARGRIVEAHVVLSAGASADDETRLRLQDHVKQAIAPYKYPRSVLFHATLPRTPTGKIQRYRLQHDD